MARKPGITDDTSTADTEESKLTKTAAAVVAEAAQSADSKSAVKTKSAVEKPAAKPPSKSHIEEEDEDDEDEDDEDEDDDEEEDEDDEEEHPRFTASEAAGAFTGLFRFIGPYILKYPKWLSIVAFGLLLETAFNVAFPLSLKYLIDDVLGADSNNAQSSLIWILGILGTAGITVSLVTIWYEYIDSLLVSNVMADIRAKLFEHLQTLSAGFYSKTKTGAITSRFGSDMTAVDEAVTHLATWGMLPFLELIAGIGLMVFLNWQLALVAMLLIPITLIGPRLLSKHAVEASYQERRAAAGLVAVVQENVSAQNVVKAFSLRRTAFGWFQNRNLYERQQAIKSRFYNAMVERSVTIAVLLLHLVVFGFGAYLTYNEEITLGTFITFESVFWEISYNIGHVTMYIPVAITGSGATRHINDLFNEPSRNRDAENAPEVPRIQKAITFDKVTFSYTGTENQITDLSFAVTAGERVAVVGPSGSGKSTVLNLLLRLYEPQTGMIRIDDCDIIHAQRDSLRTQMAVVFQDNILFDISIRENIRLGNPAATDADVEKAAKAAEIHKYIRALPQGYDTVVGERGNQMSGGQRQRIAIARAIVRDPAILLLDEATSALDHATEQAINKTLMKVSSGRTMITVTHRLSSVEQMDRILVLKDGELAEVGTHDELMKKKGVYFNLRKKNA